MASICLDGDHRLKAKHLSLTTDVNQYREKKTKKLTSEEKGEKEPETVLHERWGFGVCLLPFSYVKFSATLARYRGAEEGRSLCTGVGMQDEAR